MTDTELNTLNTLYVNGDIEIFPPDFLFGDYYTAPYDPLIQTSLTKIEWCNDVRALNNYTGYLPMEIFHLTNLQYLALDNINLTSLPPEIGNLIYLQGLWVSDNQLTTIPSEIQNLTNLDFVLDLHNNPSLGNLSNYFNAYPASTSQSNITPDGKTVTITGNGVTIDITVTP